MSAGCVLVGAHDMLCDGVGAGGASSGTRTLDTSFALLRPPTHPPPRHGFLCCLYLSVRLWCLSLSLSVDGVDTEALTLCGVLCLRGCVLVGAHDMLCDGVGAGGASSGTRTLDTSFACLASSLLPSFLFVPVASVAADDDVLHVDVFWRFALIVNMLLLVLCFCCIGFIGVCAWCVAVGGWCDNNRPGWDAECDRFC
eukprot:SAG31_NODE_1910_length_6945_cov_45.108384_7_plen_198_part_00